MKTDKNISIIGSGNVAWHLAIGLSKNYSIKQVCSRTIEHAEALASLVGASAINNIDDIDTTTNLLLIAISDDQIEAVVKSLPSNYTGLVFHTSGSVAMDALSSCTNYGVCYPLQTFSKAKEVELSQVPFFIEGNNPENLETLHSLALSMSSHVQEFSSKQRLNLHKAAVIACNFSNYMWQWAEDTIGTEAFQKLHPLIIESVNKAILTGPKEAQTGPAKRKDLKTIQKHLDSFEDEKHKELYQLISDLIRTTHG